MSKTYQLDKILKVLNVKFKIFGNKLTFKRFSSFYEQKAESCTWVKDLNQRNLEILNKSIASIFVVDKKPLLENPAITYVIVSNPREVFFKMVKACYQQNTSFETFIHPTAIISEKAKIGKGVRIGEYCIIGDCKIGDSTKIRSHTKIHDNVVIGKNVLIYEYCNIGSMGFGHAWEDTAYVNQPHIGEVIIDDDVEIFPFSNVDIGTIGSTKIGKGTKIDHYCHIGHNTHIEEHNLIMCNSTTLGGTVIGKSNILGAGTMIREGTTIGDNNFFGMRTSLLKHAKNSELWYGSPAEIVKKKIRK